MSLEPEQAVYNMKAVALETGLNPVTIRAWERRYSLPNPQRNSAGDRLYSRRDLAILRWLQARQAEGLSISNATDLWKSLEAKGVDPLAVGEEADDAPVDKVDTELSQLERLRRKWLAACLSFDASTATEVLTHAFALFPAETVCIELLMPSLAEIGAGWDRGDITIQQEHFASSLMVRRLEMLIAASPRPTRLERILVCCAPGDHHTFAPLLLTFLLQQRGWEVVYLGANVPVTSLAPSARQIKPDLAILSAQQLHTAATLAEAATVLQSEGVPVAYGGSIFVFNPRLRRHIPGWYLGDHLPGIPDTIAQRLHIPLQLVVPPVKPAFQAALREYQQRQSLLEAYVWDQFTSGRLPTDNLAQVNGDLARTIQAALKLGDVDLLGQDLDWFEHLFIGYGLDREAIARYLTYYLEAIQTYLSQEQPILLEWLSAVLTKEPVEAAILQDFR
jgi:methanogenic corrinoid protein MtbC1